MQLIGYKPSEFARRWTVNGVNVLLDVIIAGQISLQLIEEKQPGEFWIVDDGSNATADDNKGRFWSFFSDGTGGTSQFTLPGEARMTGNFVDFVNKYGSRMITAYIPEANRIMAARFPAGATPTNPVPADERPYRDGLAAGRWIQSCLQMVVWDGQKLVLA